MKKLVRTALALVFSTLLASTPIFADVTDSNGDLVKNSTISGTVTSVTTDGQNLTSVVITDAAGDTFTVDNTNGDNQFLDDLEKAFDNGNNVSITTDNSGNIETLTRSLSARAGQIEPQPFPFGR